MNEVKEKSHDQKMWNYLQVNEREERYAKNPRQEGVLKIVKRMIKKMGGGEMKILEVGVGGGLLLKKLAEDEKNKCVGADIAEENVKFSVEKLSKENLKFVVIDESGKLPFGDEEFDVVVVSEVFEHMPDEELKVSVREMKRVIKKSGRVVVSFPSHENLKVNECKCPECGLAFHKVGHKQSWDEKKVKEVFGDFKILEMEERFWRFEGEDLVEKWGGWVMWILRNGLLRMMKKRVDVPTWVLVLGR